MSFIIVSRNFSKQHTASPSDSATGRRGPIDKDHARKPGAPPDRTRIRRASRTPVVSLASTGTLCAAAESSGPLLGHLSAGPDPRGPALECIARRRKARQQRGMSAPDFGAALNCENPHNRRQGQRKKRGHPPHARCPMRFLLAVSLTPECPGLRYKYGNWLAPQSAPSFFYWSSARPTPPVFRDHNLGHGHSVC